MALTTLDTVLDVTISAKYKRVDNDINPNNIINNLRDLDFSGLLNSGTGGRDRANLLYHSRRSLNNATEYFDLDGVLIDVYGGTLDFNTVKILAILNRNTTAGSYLEVEFKNDFYYIGPRGHRIMWEPEAGLMPIVSSQSAEEGNIRVTSNKLIEYDIIIIGSSFQSSSSSGI